MHPLRPGFVSSRPEIAVLGAPTADAPGGLAPHPPPGRDLGSDVSLRSGAAVVRWARPFSEVDNFKIGGGYSPEQVARRGERSY